MKVKVTLVRSPIGRKPEQKKTVRALGLRKISQSVIQEANPAFMGMVKSVAHLVKVEEIN